MSETIRLAFQRWLIGHGCDIRTERLEATAKIQVGIVRATSKAVRVGLRGQTRKVGTHGRTCSRASSARTLA